MKNYLKIASFLIFVLIVICNYDAICMYLGNDHILLLRNKISDYGLLSFPVYFLFTTLCCVFLVPILPIAILSTLLYGPLLGVITASLSTTFGSCTSFLISRYFLNDYVVTKTSSNKIFKQIFDNTEKYGFLMLIVTRIVPAFPFGIQNYIYGITKIEFKTYAFYSFLSMLPATFIVCYGAEMLVSKI